MLYLHLPKHVARKRVSYLHSLKQAVTNDTYLDEYNQKMNRIKGTLSPRRARRKMW
jgi:hypothetical protein